MGMRELTLQTRARQDAEKDEKSSAELNEMASEFEQRHETSVKRLPGFVDTFVRKSVTFDALFGAVRRPLFIPIHHHHCESTVRLRCTRISVE